MNRIRRRAFIVASGMVGAAALAQVATPRLHLADQRGKPDLKALFPTEFGDWRVDTNLPVVLPAPDLQAKLDAIYNQVLARTYVNKEGRHIMLSVAYGGDQSDGTRAHRPEVCYPVQGFQVIYNQRDSMGVDGQSIAVRRLMARLNSRQEPITYWMTVGGETVTSGSEQKVVELRYGLRGVIPDGMLVRISNIDPEMKRGHALHDRFAGDLARALPSSDRARIFGDSPV